VVVASAGPCANHLHHAPDRQPCHYLTTQLLQARCPSCHPTNWQMLQWHLNHFEINLSSNVGACCLSALNARPHCPCVAECDVMLGTQDGAGQIRQTWWRAYRSARPARPTASAATLWHVQ